MNAPPDRTPPKPRRETLTGYLYVGPAAVILGLFSVFPVCYAFYVSLHQWRLTPLRYVGLENYRRAFSDPEFGRSMVATLYYVVGTVPVSIVLGLLAANLLAQKIRGRTIYRTVYFLPYVTSVVAAAAVWVWIFYPAEWGLANDVMRHLGLPKQAWVEESRGVFQLVGQHVGLTVPGWAAGPSLALVCVIIFSVWSSVGFDVVVLLAALTSVPKEIYEAAAIDGATGWRRMRHVTIPLISPTLYFLLIISTIRTFRVFGQIYVMASKDTERTAQNVTLFIFRTFYEIGETGYGSAIALILFAVILLVTLVQMRVVGPRVHY
jgi:multiple sugar transport system permease protein